MKLLGHVGLKGVWWSEDSFCNKKLLPGHVPRLARSEWNSILTANGYSFTLFVESLSHQQVEKKNRRSLEKLRLEEHSQLCAFWSWAVHEALANAIAVADIEILCNKVIKGDVALTLDLQSLLHERKNGISWLDLFLASFKLMMYKICFPFWFVRISFQTSRYVWLILSEGSACESCIKPRLHALTLWFVARRSTKWKLRNLRRLNGAWCKRR